MDVTLTSLQGDAGHFGIYVAQATPFANRSHIDLHCTEVFSDAAFSSQSSVRPRETLSALLNLVGPHSIPQSYLSQAGQ